MSIIQRNNLNYIYCVEQYFLSLMKAGVGLSPLDHQAIKSWEKMGIPLSVVCKGVKKGIESFKKTYGHHEPLPRTIRYFENMVEKEFVNYARLKIGGHCKKKAKLNEEEELLIKIDTLIHKVVKTMDREKDKKIGGLYGSVFRRILYLRSNIDKSRFALYSEIENIDRYFLNEFCKTVPHVTVLKLMKKAEETLSSQKAIMDKKVYEKTLVSTRNLLLRKRFGLLRIEVGN